MATPSPFPLFSLAFMLLLLSTTTAQTKVETFTHVNEGDFGPYVTEYGADYRALPVAALPFQMAFYNTTPNQFYLALRMGTTRSESVFRWVWEANRGRPVGENATFSLLPDGDLVLADADRRVAWSTNAANKGVVGFKILPNGNMVLYDSEGRFVWQSFDHPTDTLLVGQSLRAGGGPTKLVSRRSTTDGSPGDYSLELGPGGLHLTYTNRVAAKPPLRYGTVDGSEKVGSVVFECEPETEGDSIVPYAYSLTLAKPNMGVLVLARPKYNATLSFLRLEADGNLVAYTYYDPVDYQAWEKTFAWFSDELGREPGCSLPSWCGGFGVCEEEMCVACPAGEGILLGWSDSCAPPKLGACRRGGKAEYYKVAGVENFLSGHSAGEGVLKVEECRRLCDKDCKCVGFLYWEKEGRCWLAPLLGTLRKVANSSHSAYVQYLK